MKLYPKSFTQIGGIGLLIAFGSLLTACGSTNPPTQQLTETQMVVQQAEQMGANDYAPLEIREARKKLALAQKAVEEKEYDQALLLLEHAKVDAELAQMKSRSGKSQEAITELRESIRTLREETARKSGNNN